jgi:Family of unknown function (DUF5989)
MPMFKTLTNRMGVAGDLLAFFWARKLWWMMPMIVLLLAFGLLIGFAQTSAIAPFIYTLF